MGMLGDLAKAGMVVSLIEFLEKKNKEYEYRRSIMAKKLIKEIAAEVLRKIDLPPKDLRQRVKNLGPSKSKPKRK